MRAMIKPAVDRRPCRGRYRADQGGVGKASAVHFFHVDFTPGQVQRWRTGEGSAMRVIDHSNYGHAALIGPESSGFLARECFA